MSNQPSSETPVPSQGQYEFSPEQDSFIADLAKKMRLVGIGLVAFGAIGAVAGLFLITRNGLATLIEGVVNIFLGYWTVRASEYFQRIATTHGEDMTNLMDALGYLHKYYRLSYILLIIGLVLIGLVLGIILLAVLLGGGASLFK